MTLIATVGGGLVTLGGVALGFLFARRSDRYQRWNDELRYWTDELGGIYRRMLEANPKTQQEAYDAIGATMRDMLTAAKTHPTSRRSVGDALIAPMFVAIGALGGVVPSSDPPEVVEETPGKADPRADYLAAIPFFHNVFESTLKLAQTWNRDGVTQQKIDRAEKTRVAQIPNYVRVPSESKRGPTSKWGGW
jgi:hypothetical protein